MAKFLFDALIEWRKERRERRELLALPDSILDDIGLDRMKITDGAQGSLLSLILKKYR